MTLVSLLGDVGAGKTLFATREAVRQSSKPPDINNPLGRKILANYNINIKNFTPLTPEILLDKKMLGSFVILDEAYNWLEPRRSGQPINLFSSYILFQSRKRYMDIFMTDQLLETIDIRFRLMTNYEIDCFNREPDGFEYHVFKTTRGVRHRGRKFFLPISEAEKIFPLYDSWEFINPINDDMVHDISSNKAESIKQVDLIVSQLLKLNDAKVYTMPMIRDYCTRQEPSISIKMAKRIYDAIKATAMYC